MNFKLGEKYIVDVIENGIIPLMEFDRDRWFDKDNDDLDFLTDEEKIVVVNEVLNEIRAEIEGMTILSASDAHGMIYEGHCRHEEVLAIIDSYRKVMNKRGRVKK